MSTAYGAPWSGMLKGVSLLGCALLLGVPALALRVVPPLAEPLGVLLIGAPPALVLGCLLFTIRGYEIDGLELLIHRLLWSTRVPLAGLRSAVFAPDALRGSLRLFGNGGLFSFSGWFRNKRLGRYRAFLTDHRRAVVLVWDDRTIAVSPDRPERFVDDLGPLLRGGGA